MRAYLATPDTDVPVITDRDVPTPDVEEVLVRVHAVALNNADLAPVAKPGVPGFEFSGEIIRTGPGVDPMLVGSLVMGIAEGAFAEYVTAHHRHVVPVPDGLQATEATALPTGLMTEYGALRRSGIADGDSVLVTAAGSGIALLGMQVARLFGARTVIGTSRNPERRAFLEGVGADHVIITGEQNLAEATRDLTGGHGADVVLDHIGGDDLDDVIQTARVGGSVVSVGRLAGGTATLDLFALAGRQVRLQSVSFGPDPVSVMGDLLDGVRTNVLPAVADGRITPVLDRTFPFTELDDAFARLRSGASAGKVVLTLI